MTAASLAHAPDVLIVAAAGALLLLAGFRWPDWFEGGSRTWNGPVREHEAVDANNSEGAMTMETVPHDEPLTEAPCPWCDGEGGWLMEPRSCADCAGTGVAHE